MNLERKRSLRAFEKGVEKQVKEERKGRENRKKTSGSQLSHGESTPEVIVNSSGSGCGTFSHPKEVFFCLINCL